MLCIYFPAYFVTCHLGIGPSVFMRRFYFTVTWKASSTWSFDHLTGSFVEQSIFVLWTPLEMHQCYLFTQAIQAAPSCMPSSSLPYLPSSHNPGHFLLLSFAHVVFPSWSLRLPVYPRYSPTSSFLSLHWDTRLSHVSLCITIVPSHKPYLCICQIMLKPSLMGPSFLASIPLSIKDKWPVSCASVLTVRSTVPVTWEALDKCLLT